MSLEEGEFIRDKSVPEREVGVNEKIFNIIDGVRIQNIHPDFSEQPDNIFYWKGDRLEFVKQSLAIIENLSSEIQNLEITNLHNPEEKINLKEFIAKVKKSIEYSNRINEQLKEQPSETEEARSRKRAEMRKRLIEEE